MQHKDVVDNQVILRAMQYHFNQMVQGLEYIENPRDTLHFLVDQLCNEGAKVVKQRENLQ